MTTTSGRLLALLSLLQARRDWPGEVLAARLDVSGRTVRRDVDRLRELGYPIAATMGPDGGYRLEAGSDLPPLLFDDDQAVALAVALQLATVSGAGIEEAAARALTTVRQVMPARLRHRIDTLGITPIAMAGDGTPSLDPAALHQISAAIHAVEALRFDYLPAGPPADLRTPSAPVRRAEPHHLVARGGRWYVLAWDVDRDDWRTFRADRMVLRTPNGPRFAPREVPGGDVAAYVSGRFRGGGPGGGWSYRGSAVILDAERVVPHLGDGTLEDLGGGRGRIHLGAWSWLALAATFARLDAELIDVQPVGLRNAFRVLSDRARNASGVS